MSKLDIYHLIHINKAPIQAIDHENIKQNNGRTLFSFQESPELRLAILDYANDAVVAVRSFCSTMRDLKAITR